MNALDRSVLIVDDEPGMRIALKANFERDGWSVETAGGVNEAFSKCANRKFPLVVTDVRMPDGDGLHIMRAVRTSSPSTAVILLTAFGTVPEAVEAMRGGACDYLIKPVSFPQLRTVVQRVTGGAASKNPNAAKDAPAIIGESKLLTEVLNRARHAARVNADVLIEAESGTGKELLARFIHGVSSRHDKPFVAVNCAAVPDQLLESELFGHVRGAFTGATANKLGKFELAQGGTLLLDEVGDMPLSLQPKLLRALQEREFERVGDTRTVRVDIRVIATTNLLLRERVEEGAFRADLYYRLNVIPLTLPPLRERREDVPLLARAFAARFASEAGVAVPRFTAEFLTALSRHDWPGNVRELSNYIRRVIVLSDGNEIGPEFVGPEFLESAAKTDRPPLFPATPMRELERQLLESTLTLTKGNRTHAAAMLGISLRTIRNKIREFGLPPRRYS